MAIPLGDAPAWAGVISAASRGGGRGAGADRNRLPEESLAASREQRQRAHQMGAEIEELNAAALTRYRARNRLPVAGFMALVGAQLLPAV